MKSTVTVKNIHLEFLLDWFYDCIGESCGDGAAVICCSNPSETADYFIEWWKQKHLPISQKNGYKLDEFYHHRSEYAGLDGESVVSYHDDNENYIFCNKVIDLSDGDMSFIVEEDCKTFDGEFTCRKID